MATMKKISSGSLFFSKKIFPVFWFGMLALFLAFAVQGRLYKSDPLVLLMPLMMGVVGYVIMMKFVWDLVDEVYDCGDTLLVRGRGIEERVSLSDIINVNAAMNMRPPRITLRLARAGKFGTEIAFSPISPLTLNPFAKNAIAEDLIVRVDQARERRVR
jgi:hypothetical protein